MQHHYDVIIIGAGTAGLSARREVAKVTDSYLVVDDGPLGTTCARVGCMPSKVLIEVANRFHDRKKYSAIGISGGEHLVVDSAEVMSHVRALRDRFVRGVTNDMEEWRHEKLLQGRAYFVDGHTLKVGDRLLSANSIVIATGSRPIVPKAWEPFRDLLLTTDDFFEQTELPRSMAVIGLGVIGLEIGQALARLGVAVHGMGLGRSLGGISDPTIQDYGIEAFSKEMTISLTGVKDLVEKSGKLEVRTEEGTYTVDKAFLALGRRPNIDNLGLENALSVPFDLSLLNQGTYRIGNTDLFLVGDVNGDRPILHEAADEGRIAGYNAARRADQCFRRRAKLGITFTDPNIAIIGKSHDELNRESINFVTGKVSFEGQGRSIVKLKELGLLHVYVSPDGGRLLGAELFAPEGEHLAHLLAWAIQKEMTVFDVLSLPFYHPVIEEGLRTALRNAAGQVKSEGHGLEIMRCQDAPAGSQG